MRKIFFVVSKCLSCKSCELACAVEHSKSRKINSAVSESPLPVTRRSLSALDAGGKKAALSASCNHCDDALCVTACMSGAMYKNADGTVGHDETKCVGCWMCIMVCPFGAISRQEKLALKCDLCKDREKGPACVEHCPTGALTVTLEV